MDTEDGPGPANTSASTSATASTSRTQIPGPQVYIIGGVRVEFPTKAYPSQLAMMNKVIQGLKHKQNCLLESPTGSGKTLALLCATLAWQRFEASRVEKLNAEIDARREAEEQLKKEKQKRGSINGKSVPEAEEKKGFQKDISDSANENGVIIQSSNEIFSQIDDPDFKPTKRLKSLDTKAPALNHPKLPQPEEDAEDESPYFVPPDKKLTVPKIFFGTRTHKQISQITRELRKTSYKSARTVILASREHTCVNPLVEHQSNKNEACKDLLDTTGCGWQQAAKKMGNFQNLQSYGVVPGYDLEDFVAAGRSFKACPYYASRHLMTNADLILCPYNYLVEPGIRKSLGIELAGEVVVFDEAHNMEDSARDASSFSINHEDIRDALQDCEKAGRGGTDPYAHQELAAFLSSISGWLDKESRNLKELDYSNEGSHWTGTDFMAFMMNIGVLDKLDFYKQYFSAVMEQREQMMELQKERGGTRTPSDKQTMSQGSVFTFELLFRIFEHLSRGGGKFRDDFRIALLRSVVRAKKRDGWNSRNQSKQVVSLNFWCLNPSVAFCDVKDQVHMLLLTSGTLSPIQSFQSELGTPFPIKLEASHVIDKNQVWAGVINNGPTNKPLNGSFKSVETYDYQDELGKLVLRVCHILSHGVLCFFPSYRLLETVSERWQSTGLWSKLNKIKEIYIEPRTGNADFQDVINAFYKTIETTNNGPASGITGGLFLAVCRGKVSEGLDFADNNARGVICIGIPFPNYRELQVTLKREYNDKNRSRGLLSGGDWYEIQAFRALNQALGRCIRHRNDWGAILLVDDRFSKTPRYVNSLSKWVRSSVQKYNSWTQVETSLGEFQAQMKEKLPTSVVLGNDSIVSEDSKDAGVGNLPIGYMGNNANTSVSNPDGFSNGFSSTVLGPTVDADDPSMAVPKNLNLSSEFPLPKPKQLPVFPMFIRGRQNVKYGITQFDDDED